ncbi:hypothetical protein [Gymnodinialimonas ulvae]|uniref:hypothetical protein n=1 Tax=Gymnodinialimonas ulvae TaxID=3126504 RepID=UPI0030B6644A
MRILLCVLLSIWATTTAAQIPFGSDDVVETRFGSLQVVGGEVDNFIFFDGLTYDQLYATRFQIRATAGLADAEVDWALIEGPQFHDQCERNFRLLAATPRGLGFSAPFGSCSAEPVDMQVLPGQVQVTLGGSGVTPETYTFDGQELHTGTADTAPTPPATLPVRMAQSANVTTRFGRIWAQNQGQWEQVLIQDGTPIQSAGTAEKFWIRGLYEGTDRDWVIVSSNHSGNMCGGFQEWFLIQLSAAGTVFAPRLDACRGIADVRVENNALVLDMTHGDLGIARETFTWDGVTLASVLVPEAAAAPAGAGADVTRWIGRNSWEMFQDASERARMGAVMSPQDVQELAGVMSFGSQIEQRGDWVLTGSCQRHNCGDARGVWAVRISDGAVAAAILRGTPSYVTGFGAVDDPTVAAFIAEHGN